jgi:hypothetical protein
MADDNETLVWAADGYPPGLQAIVDHISLGWWPRLDVERGWWPIVAGLGERLGEIDPNYIVRRVCTDSGHLHIDAAPGTYGTDRAAFDDVIREAQARAGRTCEWCGRVGDRRDTPRGRGRVLCEDHSRPLSHEEIEFAIAGGIHPFVFTAEGSRQGAAYAAASTAAEERLTREHLSADEAADRLGVSVAKVTSMFTHGDLAGAEREGRVVYPRWQFTSDDQVLPGVREVLAAFPAGYRPLDVQAVMTGPMEELHGASPKDWLANGHPVAVLVELLSELSWTP